MASVKAQVLKVDTENANHTIYPIDFFNVQTNIKNNSKEVRVIPLSEVYEVITEEDMSAFGFEKVGENKWRNKEIKDVLFLSTNN